MLIFRDTVFAIFEVALFVNALLFIPQAIRIYRLKNAEDLSLTTFVGFCFIQAISVIYGMIRPDFPVSIGFAVSLLTCGTTTVLIIYYRYFYRKNSV